MIAASLLLTIVAAIIVLLVFVFLVKTAWKIVGWVFTTVFAILLFPFKWFFGKIFNLF